MHVKCITVEYKNNMNARLEGVVCNVIGVCKMYCVLFVLGEDRCVHHVTCVWIVGISVCIMWVYCEHRGTRDVEGLSE